MTFLDPAETLPKETDMTEWTTDPAELEALAGLRAVVGGMAASLADIPEARYLDPAGGFTLPG